MKRATKYHERAVAEVLAALARYASAAGISQRRFRALAEKAFQGGGKVGDAGGPALGYDTALAIVGRWMTDPKYSRAGKPRRLPRVGRASFSSLIRAARAGSPSRALTVLCTVGVARVDRADRVCLVQPGYIPAQGSPEKMEIFGRTGAEFLRLMTHNMTCPPGEILLQRVATYDNIGSERLGMLRRRLRRDGERVLSQANALLARHDRDRQLGAGGGRRSKVSFGVYYFDEPVAARPSRRR